jgi:hypothetical protein
MKALGGGRLVVTNYHKGNWNLDIARSMSRLLISQPYVDDLDFEYYERRGHIDYDLQKAEDDYNPEAFPGLIGPWPGNANIAQRYAIHFGLQFDGQPWLEIPEANDCDVAFHCPMRRSERTMEDWLEIVTALVGAGLNIAVLGDEPPLHNQEQSPEWDLFDSASYIAGAKCFLGTVSCCNAIAEGLGKKRFVEHAEDCFNVTTDVILNGLTNKQVITLVSEFCK